MKSILTNRFFLGSLCLLLASALTFVIAPNISAPCQAEVTAYITTAAIEQGSCITAEDITTMQIPQQYLPAGAVTEKESIIGQYAAVDLSASDYLTSDKLTSDAQDDNETLSALSEGQVAISLSLKSFASGLSAKLQPADIVSFIASAPNDTETTMHESVQYVQVLSVTCADGTEYDVENLEQGLPVAITVAATPEQAVVLADLEANASLHIALVSRGDAQRADALLTEQAQINLMAAEADLVIAEAPVEVDYE